MLRPRPSYAQGFACNAAESAYPELWDKLKALFVPTLGVTGGTLFDWSGRRGDGILDANAVWAQTPEGPSVDTTLDGIALPAPLVSDETNAFTIAISFVLDALAVNDFIYDQATTRISLWNDNTIFKTFINDLGLSASAHGLVAGSRVHLVWSVTQSPDHQYLWCNGKDGTIIQLLDDSTAFTDWGSASGAAKLGEVYTAGFQLPGKISLFAFYNRAWFAEEALSFHRDPYRMLGLRSRQYPSAAAVAYLPPVARRVSGAPRPPRRTLVARSRVPVAILALLPPVHITGDLWLVRWSSQLSGPFYVWVNGKLARVTHQTAMAVHAENIEQVKEVVEVFAFVTDEPQIVRSTRLQLQWGATASTKEYRIERYIDSSWEVEAVIEDHGGNEYMYRSPSLADSQVHQLRIVPVGTNGLDGTALTLSKRMVRHPNSPNHDVAYDDGAGTVTLTQG